MSELKCPFCNKPLQPTLRHSNEYWCENYDCPRTNIEWVGSQKLWQELIRTRKTLEQSEICCTEWEKQALDYKAENIALSSELERTRKALDVAVDALKQITNNDYDADWQNDLAQATLEKIKDIK